MDRRTKRQKLQAMANQSVSPHEAEIAKRLLDEMGPDDEPVNISTAFISFAFGTGPYAKTVIFTTSNVKFYYGGFAPSGTPYGFGTAYTTSTSPKT